VPRCAQAPYPPHRLLATAVSACDNSLMSDREIAFDLIQKVPEDTSLLEIVRKLEFIAGVREGFQQVELGEGVPAEEVREMIPAWIVK
jgi:hypothetical protein